jgi:hypothetical protein
VLGGEEGCDGWLWLGAEIRTGVLKDEFFFSLYTLYAFVRVDEFGGMDGIEEGCFHHVYIC